jgi:hypothetical protein
MVFPLKKAGSLRSVLLMRFILFFYILSLSAITAFLLTEDYITDSEFYQQYLTDDTLAVQQFPIQNADVPSEVMQSFSEGAFGDKIISQAYKIPASPGYELIDRLVNNQRTPEDTYVLLLASDSNNISTTLKYSRTGKLINVLN